MGVHVNIGKDKFPKQSDWVGKRTEVCFNYNSKDTIMGTFVRDDEEEPNLTIIKLDDGRYMLATECQHSPPLD